MDDTLAKLGAEGSRRGLLRSGVLVGLLGLTRCSRRASPSHVVERIVSVAPSMTETLFAIGAGRLVVGRSRFCDQPLEARELPIVGGFADASLERIVSLRPDWVVGTEGAGGVGLASQLERLGIATYFPRIDSVDSWRRSTTTVGAMVHRDPEAERVLARWDGAALRAGLVTSRAPRPRILLLVGVHPFVAAGPRSLLGELLTQLSLINVVKEGAYPVLGLEQILALDPDGVIDTTNPEDQSAWSTRAAAGGLRAVREGHVRVLHEDALLRPGPRLPDGLELLAGAVQGSTW